MTTPNGVATIPPFWRPFARRRWRGRQLRNAAIRWQRDCGEWSRQHPGDPLMEAVITRAGSAVRWNGPAPQDPEYRSEWAP